MENDTEDLFNIVKSSSVVRMSNPFYNDPTDSDNTKTHWHSPEHVSYESQFQQYPSSFHVSTSYIKPPVCGTAVLPLLFSKDLMKKHEVLIPEEFDKVSSYIPNLYIPSYI